jgi:hypothetical protein
MSNINLTTEQFSALLNNVNVAPKKKTKSLVKEYSNAMDFEDFLNNMKFLNVSRLTTMNLIDFVIETVKMNIDTVEDNEMPFVCANAQRRAFYYKTKGNWIKSTEFIKMLHNKIQRQCYKELVEDFTDHFNLKDDLDDEAIERQYDNSKNCLKQQIIQNLCYADKMSTEKLLDKILTKLGKLLKNNFEIVNE